MKIYKFIQSVLINYNWKKKNKIEEIGKLLILLIN